MKNETLIVGVGSSHGDDQFGWRVAEQLAERVKNDLGITIRLALSPTEILGWLEGSRRLIVCDACQNLGVPGRVHHWQWPDAALAGTEFLRQPRSGNLARHSTWPTACDCCRPTCRSGAPKA